MFFQALIRCACVPLACASVNYFVQHLRRWRVQRVEGRGTWRMWIRESLSDSYDSYGSYDLMIKIDKNLV